MLREQPALVAAAVLQAHRDASPMAALSVFNDDIPELTLLGGSRRPARAGRRSGVEDRFRRNVESAAPGTRREDGPAGACVLTGRTPALVAVSRSVLVSGSKGPFPSGFGKVFTICILSALEMTRFAFSWIVSE